MASASCAKDYFTYAHAGDQNCGCKGPGTLSIRRDGLSTYYSIGAYTKAGYGAAGPEVWNVGGAKGKGVQACYAAVMASASCAKDYFTYAHAGDQNCGCKGPGTLSIRRDGLSTYYSIGATTIDSTTCNKIRISGAGYTASNGDYVHNGEESGYRMFCKGNCNTNSRIYFFPGWGWGIQTQGHHRYIANPVGENTPIIKARPQDWLLREGKDG